MVRRTAMAEARLQSDNMVQYTGTLSIDERGREQESEQAGQQLEKMLVAALKSTFLSSKGNRKLGDGSIAPLSLTRTFASI